MGGYDDIVMLRDIEFNSHCEHHIAPFIGRVHVAYLPKTAVVGISKLARVVEIYARRLQTQETMTAQICDAMTQALEPFGVAVMVRMAKVGLAVGVLLLLVLWALRVNPAPDGTEPGLGHPSEATAPRSPSSPAAE